MKSSEPLFSSKNPFKPASRGRKTHYFPSRLLSLSEEEKQTSLSPERLKKQPTAQNQQQSDKHNFSSSVRDEEVVFTEIWPSSEWHLSPSNTTASDRLSPELGVQQEPVLAKYIERFRHGAPQSRAERQHLDYASEEKQHPFWWMADSDSPHSSTPTKETYTGKGIRPLKDDLEPAPSNAGGQCQHYSRSPSPSWGSITMLSEAELHDTEILNLQERASRLLLQDECTSSDRSIHVSSEGVGGSNFSSPVSGDEPLRRPLTFGAVKSTSAKGTSGEAQPASCKKSVFTPPFVTPLRPEEDILFQWRLRRKLEQARECPQPLQRLRLHGPTFNWQTPSFCSPSDSRDAYKERTPHSEFPPKAVQPQSLLPPQSEPTESHPSCPPVSVPAPSGSSVPEQQATASFPALMHLHCDVLPCLARCSYVGQEQSITKKRHWLQSDVSHKATQVPGNIINTSPKEAVREFRSASSPTASDTRQEAPLLQRRVEKHSSEETCSNILQRLMTVPQKKLKKSRRTVEREHAADSGAANTSSSHQNGPRDVTAQVEQRCRKGRQEKDDVPPPSSIQNALEQVVSEVLFPSRDSSSAQRTPNSLPRPASTPQQSVVSSDVLKSVDVISQLLQETEDSDEKEFDEDTLLQVLRKQRTWVKEQIIEVDLMLTELHNEQVT